MFFFPFLCSGIPDLALGILKMLIHVCFCDALQPASINLFLAWYESQSVCTVITVNLCYVQVLAMYTKVSS